MINHKVCTKCGEDKALTEYYKDSKRPGYHRAQCKGCMNQNSKKWREVNPEYLPNWQAQNPDHNRQWFQDNKEHRAAYDAERTRLYGRRDKDGIRSDTVEGKRLRNELQAGVS